MPERRSLSSLFDRGDGELGNEELLERMAEDRASGLWAPDEDAGVDETAYERWLDRCLNG